MLFRQRGGLSSVITRIEAYIDGINDDELTLPGRAEDLRSQLKTVRTMRIKFESVQNEIIAMQSSEVSMQQEEHLLRAFLARCDKLIGSIEALIPRAAAAGEFEDEGASGDATASVVATELMKFMKAYISHSDVRFQQQMDMLFSMGQNASTNNTNYNSRSVVKLPQISLPTFNGKYSEWISFRDRFKASIINCCDLSDALRMEYLQSSVSGEAKSAIKHLPLTDENFSVAWDILVDRFDKPDAISAEWIRLFHSTPTLSSAEPQKLRSLYTTVTESVNALDAMRITQRDPWLIQSVINRVDPETRTLWSRNSTRKSATWEDFVKFLGARCDEIEECSSNNKTKPHTTTKSSFTSNRKSSALITSTDSSLCRCCQEQPHPLYRCPKFLKQSANERFETVKALKLCRNCLVSSHMSNNCQFRKCKLCNSGHNLLLHDKFVNSTSGPSTSSSPASSSSGASGNQEQSSSAINLASASTIASLGIDPAVSSQPTRVFLATAVVDIFSSSWDRIPCRMVLDSGAQICVMTTALFQRLKLPKIPADISVVGVGSHHTRVKFCTQVTIQSRNSGDTFSFLCYVMPRITGNIPNWSVNTDDIPIPAGTVLADPSWSVEGPVDLLICGDSYWASWLTDKISLGPGKPQLVETVFGYVVVGEHSPIAAPSSEIYCNVATSSPPLESTLRKFWEIESAADEREETSEHQAAEDHFRSTTERNSDGRFVVKLPFKNSEVALGESRPLAVKQFLGLERRFDKNPELKKLYCEVMEDYLARGWMEKVPNESLSNKAYYMPHHGVLKDSTTTKLRVVYNASVRTSTGVSLNDLLLIGPFVQSDMCKILLRFRRHPIAVTADISKMYLQLLLSPEHTDYQRLLWRPDRSQPIGDYRIVRVCFGIASSPFHATRALIQLAEDHEQSHPLASHALRNAFYVDDFITSLDSIETAIETQTQLENVLKGAGFVLTKWVTNDNALNSLLSVNTNEDSVVINDFNTKALGVRWNSRSDVFSFPVPTPDRDAICTKRSIASMIARIFDPIGLIGPVVIEAKIILQELHEMKKGWDEPVTSEYQHKWAQFLAHLQDLTSLEVPRWISDIRRPSHTELHVFCDASMKAYGVAIYCVTKDSENRRTSRLLTAKSRVAPLQKLTIPRLELCGALLAATYADRVRNIYTPDSMYFWCDSSVVISWINRPPSSFKIFVSKRVEGILKLSTPAQWKHIPTHSNPADLISRGVTPQHLRDSQLWWYGPEWIVLPETQWPNSPVNSYYPTEEDKVVLTVAAEVPFFHDWIEKYSSILLIQRIVGFCLRFIHNTNPHIPRMSGALTTEELERALICLTYTEQKTLFRDVPEMIKRGTLSKSHWRNLCSLNPFVDDRGIIRVGGRLKNSDTSFDAKHPILLPKSRLALLLARHEHQKNLHAPPTLLLAIIRLRFWPLGGRNLVRKVVHECVICFKAKPVPAQQLMGDLPRHRVTLQKPFYAVGVDLCGPIYVKPDIPRPRGALRKIYIVVFVCLATKATHLEIVHDQSTEEFLQSFRRFCARRSRPRHVYSDCGKNFEGANNELARLLQIEQNQEKISINTRDEGILWHFNPPGSPHQGGLWEACVKSLKYHLIRVTNGSNFYTKDLSTLLCQIEAVLNSRPLYKLSDDPNDDTFLTPGHFLTGTPLVALPDPDCMQIPINRLSGSQFCQRKFQEFSKRWHQQYLNTLQQRNKWKTSQPNLMVDDAVLLLDETGRWVLGRIVETHPGLDGHTRVVSVRTKRGTYKRTITKCAKLPSSKEMDSCSTMEQAGEDVKHSA